MPRFIIPAAFLATCALALPSLADVQVFGGGGERAAYMQVFFGPNGPAGLVGIQYGQPQWKDEYDAQFDRIKGNDLRLGKDNWTTFNTDIAVSFGETQVSAGTYFFGLRCTDEGDFHLIVLEATAASKAGAVPFNPASWGEPTHVIPLEHTETGGMERKMVMEFPADSEEPSKFTFRLAWGGHELTCDGTFHMKE